MQPAPCIYISRVPQNKKLRSRPALPGPEDAKRRQERQQPRTRGFSGVQEVGVVFGDGHVGVSGTVLEPELHAEPAVALVRGVLVGVAPDFLAEILGGGKDVGELAAPLPGRTPVHPGAPVPAFVPILHTGVFSTAVLVPGLTVLDTQGDVHNPLLPPALIHPLDPGPQVGGALIEAGVMDEVRLTLIAHHPTMVPVEVVQIGLVHVGSLTDIHCAARLTLPGGALAI